MEINNFFVIQSSEMSELITQLKGINMNLSEGVAIIHQIRDQLIKAKEEITEKLAAMEEALSHLDVPVEEAMAALDELKGVASALDNIVPDAPEPVAEEEPAQEETTEQEEPSA